MTDKELKAHIEELVGPGNMPTCIGVASFIEILEKNVIDFKKVFKETGVGVPKNLRQLIWNSVRAGAEKLFSDHEVAKILKDDFIIRGGADEENRRKRH